MFELDIFRIQYSAPVLPLNIEIDLEAVILILA